MLNAAACMKLGKVEPSPACPMKPSTGTCSEVHENEPKPIHGDSFRRPYLPLENFSLNLSKYQEWFGTVPSHNIASSTSRTWNQKTSSEEAAHSVSPRKGASNGKNGWCTRTRLQTYCSLSKSSFLQVIVINLHKHKWDNWGQSWRWTVDTVYILMCSIGTIVTKINTWKIKDQKSLHCRFHISTVLFLILRLMHVPASGTLF